MRYEARANDGMALQLDRKGFQEGVALLGMAGRCGGETALYSSSLRLSGMGVLERGQAPYHKPNRGMTGEGAPPLGEGSGPAGFGRSDRNPGPRERTAHQAV